MYTAAEIKKMVKNRGQRSKLSFNQLPEKYRLMRAKNAVMGKKGAKAPQSYRDKLIQQMQANPGQRALLPDRYLTPQQRQSRSNNTYLNSELFPGSGLRGRDLETQVRRGVDLQYGDQQQADANALAQTQATRTRNQAWWDQYQNAVQNAQTAFNQYAQAQQAPQISTSAPVVNGQVASPTAPAASGVQAALGSIAAGRANANQLASAAGLASGVNIAGQRVGEQRGLLDQAVMNALGQQKQTSRRKAMSAEDLRTKLVNEASQRFIERQALMSKEQIAALNRAQQLQLAQMQSDTTRRGQDITARGQDISADTTRRGQDLRNKPDKGKPKFASASKQAEYLGAWPTLKGAAISTMRHYNIKGKKYGSDWIARQMMAADNAPKVPEAMFQAAAELARDHFVHDATIEKLHRQGVKFNQLGAPRKKYVRTRGGNVGNNSPR